MLQIGKYIVSLDLIRECFCCDLHECKGMCCEEGDNGAPISEEEKQLVESDIEKIKPYMSQEGRTAVENSGVAYTDQDGDLVTQLVNKRECAFSIKRNGIWFCAIEEAFNNGDSTLRKPISCYLYPVRISEHKKFVAVEYHRWNICKQAICKGKELSLPLYKFLKKPLIERFGQEWYDELDLTAKEFLKQFGTK